MNLHIFNPEHDMALAHDDACFTSPHAGREMRADLGFLPALWAKDGDFVIVDDVEAAIERVRHLGDTARNVLFVTEKEIGNLMKSRDSMIGKINVFPWGWDKAVRHKLHKLGIPEKCMPDDRQLDDIRNISGRIWANTLREDLPIYNKGVLAMPRRHESVDDFLECYYGYYEHRAVVKSPWSCSGRGVRYLEGELDVHTIGWLRNVICRQGHVVSEKYYDKVKDFALEFYAHDDGRVTYEGMSLFKTINGAYAGNVIATETEKQRLMSKYSCVRELPEITSIIVNKMQACLRDVYTGPFGVDMMILYGDILHPCVELNLRRTMGHVALAVSHDHSAPRRLMRIEYTGSYHLRILNTFEDIIDNSLM